MVIAWVPSSSSSAHHPLGWTHTPRTLVHSFEAVLSFGQQAVRRKQLTDPGRITLAVTRRSPGSRFVRWIPKPTPQYKEKSNGDRKGTEESQSDTLFFSENNVKMMRGRSCLGHIGIDLESRLVYVPLFLYPTWIGALLIFLTVLQYMVACKKNRS